MRVAPGGFRRLQLKGVVVEALWVGGSTLAVPLGQPPEQPCPQAGARRLLQPRNSLLLLLGLLGVLDDGVTIERGPEVDLKDSRELVGIDQVDDGDGPAEKNAERPSDHHEVEAPTVGEGEDGLLHPDEERSGRDELRVDEVGEEEEDPSEEDEVGPVAWDHDQQQVRQQPQCKRHPSKVNELF